MITDKEEMINNIISYCLIEKANTYEYDVLDISEFGFDEDTVEDKLNDYDRDNPLHNKILKSANFFSISLGGIEHNIKRHEKVSKHINYFTAKYGKDSYTAIGKNLAFDCRDKGFNFDHFKLLCAINSILGRKKKFARITYDRILYAMNGYRSKTIYEKEQPKIKLLSSKQLRSRIEFLHAKKLFSKFTYRNRQIFYSTQLDDEQLKLAVKNSKIFWAKKKMQIVDRQFSDEIKSELDDLKSISQGMRERVKLNLKRVI